MASTLSRAETWSLLTLSVASAAVLINNFFGDGEPLIASLAFSGIAFAFTYSLIRWLGDTFMRAGLKGVDMSKVKKVAMYVLEFLVRWKDIWPMLILGPDQNLWALFAPLSISSSPSYSFHSLSMKTSWPVPPAAAFKKQTSSVNAWRLAECCTVSPTAR